MAVVKSFNILPQVVEDVAGIIEAHPGKKIIWFCYSYSHWVDTLQAALKERSLKLDYVVDNDHWKWGRVSPFGVIVSPPELVIRNHRDDSVVLICSNFAEEIKAEILAFGYSASQVVVLKSPDEYAEKAETVFRDDIEGLERMSLRALQLCETDILREAKRFCSGRNLRYYLSGGTCAGAARYKGFIPWDDDIDIQMPYEDFMEFVSTYPRGGRYEVVFWKYNDEFFFPYAQLVDNQTVMLYKSFPVSLCQGVAIDIFPTAGSPEEPDEIAYRTELFAYLDAQWRWFYQSKGVLKEPVSDRREELWSMKYDIPFDGSSTVTTPFESSVPGIVTWILPREVFAYGETLEFEGEPFSVMKDWRRFLKTRYPNWRPLTPEEQKAYAHPTNAYWK